MRGTAFFSFFGRLWRFSRSLVGAITAASGSWIAGAAAVALIRESHLREPLFAALRHVRIFHSYPLLFAAICLVIAAIVLLEFAVCIAIHELGHALAAKMIGWRVYVITVRPFSYFPLERRVALARGTRATGDFAGWVYAASLNETGTASRVLYVLGGVTANLLLAAVGLMLLWHFYFPLYTMMGVWKLLTTGIFTRGTPLLWLLPFWEVLILGISLNSILLGVSNLIPYRGEGWRSDGAIFLDLLFRKREPRQNRYLVMLYSVAMHGARPAYWGAALVRKVEGYEGTAAENLLRDRLLLAHYYALADVGRARLVIERVMQLPGQKSPGDLISYAFLLGFVDRKGVEAQKALDDVPDEHRNSFQYWRAMAVARYVSGDTNGALEAAMNMLAIARRKRMRPDRDDRALVSAIRKGLPLPKLVPRQALA